MGRRKRWAEAEFPEMEQDRPCVAFAHPLPNCPPRVAFASRWGILPYAACHPLTLSVLFERRCRAPAIKSEEDDFPSAASGSARPTLGKPKKVTTASPVSGS